MTRQRWSTRPKPWVTGPRRASRVQAHTSTAEAKGLSAEHAHPVESMTNRPGPERSEPTDPHAPGDRLVAQVQVPVGSLGLATPPHTLRVRLMNAGKGWRLMAWSEDGEIEGAVTWLKELDGWTPAATTKRPEHLVVLEAADLPSGWTWARKPTGAITLTLRPDGRASLSAEGLGKDLGPFVSYWEDQGHTVSTSAVPSPIAPDIGAGILTRRQSEALSRAAAAGYYDIPRRVRLEDLAGEMDMSMGGLSELLRRAESRLVKAYISTLPGPGEEDEVDLPT